MKIIVLIALLLPITQTTTYSQSYRFNDTLYLWEMHGADMVLHPDVPVQKIAKFYYGSEARIVDMEIGKYPVSVEVNPDYNLHGSWVKVIIGKDTGYVFDGFLSPLKPFDLRSNEKGIALLKKNYHPAEAVGKDVRMFDRDKPEEGQQMDLAFNNGLYWNMKNIKSCLIETYTYSGRRLSEAYQFMMAVYSNYFDQGATFMSEPEFIRRDGNKYKFSVKTEDANRRITLYKKGSHFIISSHYCPDKIK